MKAFLSVASLILFFAVLTFQAQAKDHGRGKGNGKGHGHGKHKQYHKKPKHYCSAHCHGGHHVYREKVILVQPVNPRPSININLPL